MSLELVAVDNASTDNTRGIFNDIWSDLGTPFPLKIVNEQRLGLAYARKSGVLASSGEFGVFCDDDNWLPPNYCSVIANIFNENPGVGVIGSSSVPVSKQQLPPWFYRYATRLAVGTQSELEGDVTFLRPFVWGAGMAVRLRPLRHIYAKGIDPLVVGRRGLRLTSGDDSEICVWFLMMDYRIWNQRSLVIKHFMPQERLTEEYLLKFRSVEQDPILARYFAFVRWRFRLANKVAQIRTQLRSAIILISSPKDAMKVLKIFLIIKRVGKSSISPEPKTMTNTI